MAESELPKELLIAKQDDTKSPKLERTKYQETSKALGDLGNKVADEEFKLRVQPSKTSDTPGKSRFPNAPSNYIVVNDSSLINGTGTRSLVLLIDWNTFIEDVVAYDEKDDIGNKIHKSALYAAYTKAVEEVLSRLTKRDNNTIPYGREHLLNMYVNKSILELKTTLANNLAGNSCSFSLENFDDKWIVLDKKNPFWGQSIIQEGMRFTVDGRGRFKPDNFYRQFTGYITGINEKSNPTDKSLSFSCADASRTLKYTRYNVSPAIYTGDVFTNQGKPRPSKTNLVGMNGAEIIKEVVLSDAKTDKYELDKAYQWTIENDATVEKSSTKGGKSNTGLPIEKKTGILESKYRRNWHVISREERFKSYAFSTGKEGSVKPRALLWGHTGDVYTFMFGQLKLRFDEFMTKADILNNLANLTHYVTYIDGAGNLHYHPPRFESEYELMIDGGEGDSMEHPLTYSIFDDETIAQSYSQNEGEVCTIARGMGEGDFGIPQQLRDQQIEPNYAKANIAWVDGVSRFGFRERKISTAAFTNVNLLTIFTAGFLIRANQERYQMTAQMIMRPELQPDRPIYDYTKNKWYNIRSVTHTYMAGGPNSGGSYTTDIICYAGRNPGENVAANLFAAADLKTINDTEKMKEFLATYSTYYNLEDFGSMSAVKRKEEAKKAGTQQ